MAGEGFERCMVAGLELVRKAFWDTVKLVGKVIRGPESRNQHLRRLFINTGLYVKPADQKDVFLTPHIVGHKHIANGLVLHLRLPWGMTPQDLERTGDRLAFALGGAVCCRPTNTPQMAELVITTKGAAPPPAANTRQDIAD